MTAKPSALRREAAAWAASAKGLPAQSCSTCAWLAKNVEAAEFHAGVVDVLRGGGTLPVAALFREMARRFRMPIKDSAFNHHWRHVKRDVAGG